METNTNNKKSLLAQIKASKFCIFMKSHKKIIITSSIILALILCITLPFIEVKAEKGNFSHAFNDYKNIKGMDQDISLNVEASKTNALEEISDGTTSLTGKSLEVGDSLTFETNIPATGFYKFYPTYLIQSNGFIDHEFKISVDSNIALERAKIRASFKNESDKFVVDSYGNEVVPSQKVIKTWSKEGLYDLNFVEALPYSFELSKGNHEIKFELVNGEKIALSNLNIVSQKNLISYEEYISKHAQKGSGLRIDDIEGEKFALKNDTTPIPTSLADLNAFPYHSTHRKLNSISNFTKSNQILVYEFDVEKSGLYMINFNSQVKNSNHTTFATIFIDDEVPFGELLHYPFSSTHKLEEEVLKDNDGNNFKFYLEEGRHTLKIKIDTSLYKEISFVLEQSVKQLNAIYLSLKRIAGTVKDNNKEWDPDTDFPGIKEEIEEINETLISIKPLLHKINGSNANFQAVIHLESAINAIKGILKKPKLIPNNYYKFSEGSGSIIESISNAKTDIENTPLEIDRIIIGSENDHQIKNKKNNFNRFIESIKKFFLSFSNDYSSKKKGEKTIEIWVARSRQYVDLMQQMFDASTFKEDTGYDVQFTLLADESKLILSNAAKVSPDGVMGISNWLPYEMGIRDLTVDLTKFSDYKDVITRFSPGSLISLIADGKGLALPETQDFYVTYYRKDICEKYGYEIPNTWDEVLDILPRLQRNGFNYYIPLSSSSASKSIMTTAPFIYQNGGNLFSDDGTRTTIDEESSLDAIKFMTELYTLYGLQDQVSNFFDAFRNGSLPIGLSTFDTYVKLMLGAPEIEGMWDIKLSPGTLQKDGTISRWQTGSAQSMCLIDKNEEKNKAGWELLKWWSSKEVQSEFAQKLTLLYGKGYIWNSANLEAFNESIIFSKSQKEVILEQWEWMREIPRVPGWYMLERELSNAWNNIVLKAQNTRAVIENAVTLINKELQRKLIEFGYLNSKGEIVTPYKVTTLDSIAEIIAGGGK